MTSFFVAHEDIIFLANLVCTPVLNKNNIIQVINLLTPNDNCSGRTAPLTSKVAFYIFIQQI